MKIVSQEPSHGQIPSCEIDPSGAPGEPLGYRLSAEVGDVSDLPPVDWDNIQKDPRRLDLENHEDECACDACMRAVARMSSVLAASFRPHAPSATASTIPPATP